MSEDPTLAQSAAADKPKRGRKRKVASDADSIAAAPDTALSVDEPLEETPEAKAEPSAASFTHSDTAPPPEAFAAAMALESVADTVAPATSQGRYSPCGGALKAAREALGLSIHQVSSQLRLGIGQIQAIEQDDFSQLPQASIVRGFIRNYARLLNIDPQPVLQAYQVLVPEQSPASLTVRSNASHSVINSQPNPVKPKHLLKLLALIVVLAVAAYFYLTHVKPTAMNEASLAPEVSAPVATELPMADNAASAASTEAASSTETTGDTQNATQALALPEGTSAEVAPASALQPVPLDNAATNNVATNPVAQTTPPSPSPSASALPANAGNTSTATPPTEVSATGDGSVLNPADPQVSRLEFTVNEESWVRIETAQGKSLLSALLPANTQRMVLVKKPVNITIGHAAGTQLRIDQQPYDLTPATRGRVARLQLK